MDSIYTQFTIENIVGFTDLSVIRKGKFIDIEIMNVGASQFYAHAKGNRNDEIKGEVRILIGNTGNYFDAKFKSGFPEGEWMYYENDMLHSRFKCSEGYLEGLCVGYAATGMDVLYCNYKKTKIHGDVKRYTNKSELIYSAQMHNGLLHGTETYFTKDGIVRSKQEYLYGKKSGESFVTATGSMGIRYKHSIWHHGVLDGEYIETDENKIVRLSGFYDEGKKDDNWTERDDEGLLKLEEKYDEGKLIHRKIYNKSGVVTEDCEYLDGKYHGYRVQRNADGVLKSEEHYEKGKRHGQCFQRCDWGRDNIRLIYSTYKKGDLDGEYYETTDEDILMSKGIYRDGFKEGKWLEREDDTLIYPTYVKGNKHGDYKVTRLDGSIIERGFYEMNRREGDWIEYDEKGNIVDICRYSDGGVVDDED